MSTEMRRGDRAMKTVQEMEALLEQASAGRLAVMTGSGPYIVPMNYLFLEGCIYFHSSPSGRKIDALRADPRVCFQVDKVGPQVLWDKGCGISQIYRSVICFGRAEFIDDRTERETILERMLRKYLPPSYPLNTMKDHDIDKTAVVRITVEKMSGKAHDLSASHTIIANRFNPLLGE